MDCRSARQRIQDGLDGRLPPRESAELLEHLRGCRGCAAEEESLRRVGDLLRMWSALRVQEREPRLDSLWSRVKGEIDGRREPWYMAAVRRWFWVPAAAALAALALLFYPSDRTMAPFHPKSFEVSVETLESDSATVALVDSGENLPRVIWILEDGTS